MHFTQVAKRLCEKIPDTSSSFSDYLRPSPPSSLALYPTATSAEEIMSMHSTMKISHSIGHDLLDPVVIGSNLDYISKPLANIYNCSMANGVVPLKMKLSTVTPIFKQGD